MVISSQLITLGLSMSNNVNFKAASLLLGAAMVFASPALSKAETRNHETRFSVKFAGIEIGQATFKIKFDDESYSLKGTGKTAGLAEWFSTSTGEVSSSGDLIENTLKPKEHYAAVTEKKKKTESVKMSFSEDKVSEVSYQTNKPRKEKKAPRYVPVEAKHLARVLDPASSLIIPMSGEDARDGRKVCNQNFPIYDGETRYNIRLSFKHTKPIRTDGYNGHAYVCQMRYVPVAGHKIDHRTVKEMAKSKKMEIWLAPMGGVSVFTPIKILVPTKYGRFSAVPTRFSLVGS